MAEPPATTLKQADAGGSDGLLATKLYLPRPLPGFVARPRLVERLEEGLARGLLLVCAPAGFGKTVLLAHWARQGRRPVAWLSLDHADNDSDCQLTGASPFPRHWLYDHTGRLVAKSGLIDFQTWYRQSSGQHTPWGGERSPALVTAVESALERQLSAVMIGSHPRFVRLRPGEDLVAQGAPGGRLFVLFDGVLLVLRDGR